MDYTEEHIFTNQGLSVVRQNPTLFFSDLELAGMVHWAKEPLDNDIDELTSLATLGVKASIVVILFRKENANTFQLLIKDTGRGIPKGSIVKSTTVMNTSGKYAGGAYKYSSGQFGLGLKGTTGTSKNIRFDSHRTDARASFYIHEATHGTDLDQQDNVVSPSGTSVMMEPSDQIFTSIADFPWSSEGFHGLLSLISKYCFFHNYDIKVGVVDELVDPKYWTMSLDDAAAYRDAAIQKASVVFDSETFDRNAWLRDYWSISRNASFQFEYQHKVENMEVILRLFYYKENATWCRLGMVNNVPMDNPMSDPMKCVYAAIQNEIAPKIEDKHVRTFFLESYRLPIGVASDIRFAGAKFTGTTKHNFVSVDFRNQYNDVLEKAFTGQLNELIAILLPDIEKKYKASLGGNTKKSGKRTFEDLQRPGNWFDWDTRSKPCDRELFLVEGGSAVRYECRDSSFQGIYALQGKPINALEKSTKRSDIIQILKNDPYFNDIFTLLNLNPWNYEPDKLNAQRLMLMADGDPDGQHIVSIVFGNLQAACPEFVRDGRVFMITPPYYRMSYGRGAKKHHVYLRSPNDVLNWVTSCVLMPNVGFKVTVDNTTVNLTDYLTYRDFVHNVIEYGRDLTNLAAELMMSPEILDALTYATPYIAEGSVNIAALREMFPNNNVRFQENGEVLILDVSRQDHYIPLVGVRNRIHDVLTPRLRRLNWKKLQVYITLKTTQERVNQPVTLFEAFRVLSGYLGMFTSKFFKGLGELEEDDFMTTCTAPATRTVYSIREIGDVGRIHTLLGKNSKHRKNLLVEATATINSTFDITFG